MECFLSCLGIEDQRRETWEVGSMHVLIFFSLKISPFFQLLFTTATACITLAWVIIDDVEGEISPCAFVNPPPSLK